NQERPPSSLRKIFSGTLLRTSDGGVSWTVQRTGTANPLYAVSFADPGTASAVGYTGEIFRSEDGGLSWVPQTTGILCSLNKVSLVDANTGTAVGPSGIILRTIDGQSC